MSEESSNEYYSQILQIVVVIYLLQIYWGDVLYVSFSVLINQKILLNETLKVFILSFNYIKASIFLGDIKLL